MLRMKKVLKGIIRGLDHIVNFIALSLILAAMFLSGYMLWDSHQVYQTADAKNYEAYIPTEKSTKSFEELQKINPDVIGWIRVNDTNINYPLVQTDNDDTYMNTDAEGNYSLSGAIFLHCANKPDFSDFDNIIYGHHMEKHMMFGDIGEFTKEQYFNEHPYGNLFFDGKDHGIEFYALMQVDAYNETIFNVCLDTPEAKQEAMIVRLQAICSYSLAQLSAFPDYSWRSRRTGRKMRKMRHKNWKTYLKIACSWLLIFSDSSFFNQ